MTISVLVCDDLPEERSYLTELLRCYERTRGVEMKIGTASDGTELLSLWRPRRWDVIFLDIYMTGLNGIDAARKLREVDDDVEIVFATTSLEHGMAGYELHAMDYLSKPFRQQDVERALDWFFESRAARSRELTVRTQEGEQSVRVCDIRFIESRGHSCIIHAGGREVVTRGSIGDLAEGLGGAADFFRCHQSFLLNFAHVVGVEKRGFLLDGGERIPISAANLSQSRTAYVEWAAARDRDIS